MPLLKYAGGKMIEAYISIGSNISPKENIKKCLDILTSEFKVIAISPMYETKPYGYEKQANFLNLAVVIKTGLKPHELLEKLQQIENRLGRKRLFRFSPRTIDLDILLYNSEIIDDNELVIPHKGLFERDFMLIPLLDIAPEISNPITGKKAKQLKEDIKYKQNIQINGSWIK